MTPLQSTPLEVAQRVTEPITECIHLGCREPITLAVHVERRRSDDHVHLGGFGGGYCDKHGHELYEAMRRVLAFTTTGRLR